MAITDELLREAIRVVASTEGVHMAPEALVEDVALVAKVWPGADDFKTAIASTVRAMEHARDSRITPDSLAGEYADWWSYHYQPKRCQGAKATMRLIYRPMANGIEVKGFGHRYRPIDLYHRILHDAIERA